MPTVTRTVAAVRWSTANDGDITRGQRVRVIANRDEPYSEDNHLGEGVIAGWYNDTAISTRVYVVLFASPLQVSMADGPYSEARLGGPVSLSRLVVHRDALMCYQPQSSTETIECPPCLVCGEPAHGDVVGLQPPVSYCDECAIDRDLTLTVWPEIRERQVRAEEEVAETSPRRRRQAADRVAAIEAGETESPHPAREFAETVAALDASAAARRARRPSIVPPAVRAARRARADDPEYEDDVEF